MHAASRPGTGQQALTLTAALVAVRSHTIKKLTPAEQAAHKMRLLLESGIVKPWVLSEAPAASGISNRVARNVYVAFCEVLGLHCALVGRYTAIPFTWQFIEIYCGISHRAAGQALDDLKRADLIRAVDKVRSGYRDMLLYFPGEGNVGSAVRQSAPGQARKLSARACDNYLPWGGLMNRRVTDAAEHPPEASVLDGDGKTAPAVGTEAEL